MMMLCVCLYDVGNTKLNNEGSVPISKCQVSPKQTHFSVEATWHVILVVYPATWRNVYKCFDGARRRVEFVSAGIS